MIAVMLERALAPLTGFHPPLIALDPPSGDAGEPELRRRQRHTGTYRLGEDRALRPRRLDVVADGTEARPAAGHETDGVLPVGLQINALLDSHAAGRLVVLAHVSSDHWMQTRRIAAGGHGSARSILIAAAAFEIPYGFGAEGQERGSS